VTTAMEQLAHTSVGNFIHIFRTTGMQICKYNSVSLILDSWEMLRLNTICNIRTTGECLRRTSLHNIGTAEEQNA